MSKRSKVQFVDEVPPPARRQYPWSQIAKDLRARPGEWAVVVRDMPSSVAWAVNAGRIKAVHPDLGFETRARKTSRANGDRITGEFYMRYDRAKDKSKRNGAKR